jgi:hypothetical protein
MNIQNLSTFTYGDIALSQAVLIDNVPYLTRKAIGEWLEYADPQKQIDKILERNPHIEMHSVPVNLGATDGKNYETNVYHPIGFLLIVMESGQPKAKDKKVEVAEFVWHFSNPGTERLSSKERRTIKARITTLTIKMPGITDAMALQALWDEITELSNLIGRAYPDLKLLGKDRKQACLPGFDVTSLN